MYAHSEPRLDIVRLWYAAKGWQSEDVKTPDHFIDPPFSWKGRRPVLEDASSITLPAGGSPVFVEPTDRYKVFVSSNWLTNRWCSAKSTTGFTIDFSVPAPASAWIDYAVLSIAVATAPRQGIATMTENAASVTLTVDEMDTNYKIHGTPSWNTGYYYDLATKTRTSITIYFGVPAPDGGQFDWVAPA